jgi:hypothetical protein
MKFIFFLAIFALSNPDLDCESGTVDPIESGSNPNPDPQHCLQVITYGISLRYLFSYLNILLFSWSRAGLILGGDLLLLFHLLLRLLLPLLLPAVRSLHHLK